MGPLPSVLALAIGWFVSVGCAGGHGLPVGPASGGAGWGAAGLAGASGADATGSAGATSGAAGATSGAAGTAADGAAGATSGAAGSSTDGAAGATSGGAGWAADGGAAGAGGIAGSGGPDDAPACTRPCPTLTCEVGSAPALDPAIPCCPVCKSVKCASSFTCTPLSCLPGTHAEVGPGQCCASCVPNAGSCEQARADYMNLEAMLRDQLGGPCRSDSECTFAVENNGCVSSCFIPLTIAGASMFDSVLRTNARTCDTVCGIPAPISCSNVPVVCTQGRCAPKPTTKP